MRLKSVSVARILCIAWIGIGLWYNQPYLKDLYSWQDYLTYASKDNQRNLLLSFYGEVYRSYELFSQTPQNSRILYLTPDINYFGRLVYFIYPRIIDTVTTPADFSAKASQNQYDYAFIQFVGSTNSGFFMNLAEYQQQWAADDLIRAINQIASNAQLKNDQDLNTYLESNNGLLLYKLSYD